jgi:chromosome segregation ATPase
MPPLWLKSVPWSTIVSNAPLIIGGAKKLVSLVQNKPAGAGEVTSGLPGTSGAGARPEFAALQARIQQLEQEQREAADLLRTMAQSHDQMVQALEALRRRARLGLYIALLSLVGITTLLLWTLMH